MRIALLHLREGRPHAPEFDATLAALNRAAVDAVASLGWRAQLVASATAPVSASVEAARAADAVVILGGEDVDPRLYGGPIHYPEGGHHEPEADAAHLAVIHDAIRDTRPLLGICRGLQLMNVALGGTLVSHLDTTDRHRGTGRGMDAFRSVDVELVAGAHDLGADVVREPVRCTHHQAIDELGRGLVVAARARDGVIEAVVHESAPLTGVQWHPEHPDTARTQLVRLLRRLERQRDDATPDTLVA